MWGPFESIKISIHVSFSNASPNIFRFLLLKGIFQYNTETYYTARIILVSFLGEKSCEIMHPFLRLPDSAEILPIEYTSNHVSRPIELAVHSEPCNSYHMRQNLLTSYTSIIIKYSFHTFSFFCNKGGSVF